MKRFILSATIAVALLGTSQFANAQSRDDRDGNNNGKEQYEDRGDRNEEGQFEEQGREGNDDQQYGYNNDDRDQGYDDRQDYNNGQQRNDGFQNRQGYGQRPPVQGGINRPDYGRHAISPVRAQYLRLRQLRGMAMADGFITYRERMMLAREEDKLDWMRRRYGRF